MIIKRPIRPDRLHQVPPSFSWVDHRLVSARFIERCDPPSVALYLFVVTVADVQGLSFYSDASIRRRLRLGAVQLSAARQQLERAGLIAFQKPLYQVLSLDSPPAASPTETTRRTNQTHSVAEILRRVKGIETSSLCGIKWLRVVLRLIELREGRAVGIRVRYTTWQ